MIGEAFYGVVAHSLTSLADAGYNPEEEASAGIRNHIVAFWTPGKRSTFLAFARVGGPGLDLLVAEAMRTWPDAESPVVRATAPAKASGQGASDAG